VVGAIATGGTDGDGVMVVIMDTAMVGVGRASFYFSAMATDITTSGTITSGTIISAITITGTDGCVAEAHSFADRARREGLRPVPWTYLTQDMS
jgi:hypothetical protein